MASSTVVTKNGEAFWNKMPGARHRANLNSMYDAWLLALEEAVGPQGWSPVFGVTTNGDRRVLQIVDWVGGAGAKPSITGYIGPSGIVPTAGAAVDIRGTQGLKGDQGDKGNTGNHGWSPQIRTTIDGERVVQELYDWTGGQGSKPATGYIGVSGLVSNIADASNIRGGKGDTGDTGPANELTIGTVESGATPSVTITGESPQQVLNFVLEKGDTGNTAWTPVYTAVADGERSILRIDDWTGGQGTKPATGYLGPLGVVANVGDALDIRGAPGSGSVSSVNEIDPDGSGNVALGIADIPGLEDALDNAGQVKTVAGKGPDGSGNVALVKGDVGLDNVDNTSDANKPVSSATLAALGNKIDAAEKGAALGVAPLDASGHVPAINLPSYVDDVLEYANFGALPGAGETGKIYVTLNDNKTWRWGGSAYVEISASPGSTD
ncbi:MAG: hypothetical protein M0P09_01230, partial [Acholeplasmataceae bacterium]|nr:hypothetical protein [Acholeplasmataceae bacterium]